MCSCVWVGVTVTWDQEWGDEDGQAVDMFQSNGDTGTTFSPASVFFLEMASPLLTEMQRSRQGVCSDLPERGDWSPNNPRSLSIPFSSLEPVLGSGNGWGGLRR